MTHLSFKNSEPWTKTQGKCSEKNSNEVEGPEKGGDKGRQWGHRRRPLKHQPQSGGRNFVSGREFTGPGLKKKENLGEAEIVRNPGDLLHLNRRSEGGSFRRQRLEKGGNVNPVNRKGMDL